MHYCITPERFASSPIKEFFAEMSVTYWARGYSEFDGVDMSSGMVRDGGCSPPIIEPRVLARLQESDDVTEADLSDVNRCHVAQEKSRKSTLTSIFSPLFYDPLTHNQKHCNKFYPFTSGQFQRHDPDTFKAMDRVWSQIADWVDPAAEEEACSFQRGCSGPPLLPRFPAQVATAVEDTVDL